ncbi:MAG: FAD-dependent thymidylate synthase [Candidatus Harrisonbacteria bacterium]|nr:FAD-dependent thymidylate synthase [Candidatus Harrisonbacteria bacterium]
MEKLPERIVPESSEATLRPISSGAEKWLYRPIKCLNHGFIYLVDYMGNDTSVVEAARVSYGRGTKKVSEDRGLIRYLRRHVHTTPLEMVEFKFHCKMPIFVARQWIRHRTANVNEYSGRYSVMSNEFYLPEPSALAKQSQGNRQGRGESLSPQVQQKVLELLKAEYISQYAVYENLLKFDLARELARIGLSVANYTEWYWKIDVHNLLHFLRLRLDKHAQYEIRVYGEAMARIIKDALPTTFEAFEDYQLHAMNLSRLEIEFIKDHSWPMESVAASCEILKQFKNKRETEEFVEKLKNLNLVK